MICRFLEVVCRKKDWGCELEEVYGAVRRTFVGDSDANVGDLNINRNVDNKHSQDIRRE